MKTMREIMNEKKGKLTTEQILRLMKILITMTAFMVFFEGIFSIPVISNYFSNVITSSTGWVAYLIVFTIMFLQTNILNIPAISVIGACQKIMPIFDLTYILVVMAAYLLGCAFTYWLGRKFGVKAVKWASGSEEDFEKWSKFLNNKTSRIAYFCTVLFPIFPDDILCLCAGAVKMNFGFYMAANAIGRTIGLICAIMTIDVVGNMSGDFPTLLVAYAAALIAEVVIYFIIKKKKIRKENIEIKKEEE